MDNAGGKGKMKALSKKEFFFLYKKIPRVTVDIVIKDKRGILLIKRSIKPDMGKWHFPGGTVNYKEKLLDAAKRQAKNETGLNVKIKKFLGVKEFTRWRRPAYGHIVDLIFLAEPVSGKLKGNPKIAGKKLKFFRKPPKNMMREQREVLEGALMK